MAIIGRGKAVTAIGNRYVGGFIGWLSWLAIHAMFLVGFRRKVFVLLSWLWSYMTSERAGRIIIGDPKMDVKQVLVEQTTASRPAAEQSEDHQIQGN